MKIARILYPVKNLGPGNRIGIWFSGCHRYCKGCANPELWDDKSIGDISGETVQMVIGQLRSDKYPEIDGVTISGGEPFLQPDALREVINILLKENITDILVYSGYQKVELEAEYKDILEDISVLVDGAYIQEENDGHPLKGSKNQMIHYMKQECQDVYEKYILEEMEKNHVQMFTLSDGKIATGIHRQDFLQEYDKRILKKI